MSSFDIAYANTKTNEGGYANNPKDSGGETYAGISRVHNPSWSGWPFIDQKKKAGPIKTNTVFPELAANVKSYYKAHYWDNESLGLISNQSIANLAHDTLVTSGAYIGWMMKKALEPTYTGAISKSIPFTTATIAQINSAKDQESLFERFWASRKDYFTRIAKGDNATFLDGWINRLNTFSFDEASKATTEFVKKNKGLVIGGLILTAVLIFIAYQALYRGKKGLSLLNVK